MTNSEKMFLLLAEELNFSRAAQRAYISQQCLSDHIRRLEENYNAKLFHRRPKVELTDAGRAVQRTLFLVQNIEQGLSSELSEIENGARGTLRIGMNYTRARLLLPQVFAAYHERYPQVRVELTMEETAVMQEKLRKGQLDCFLGINATSEEPIEADTLTYEGLYLMASPRYLRQQLGIAPETLTNLESHLDLKLLQGKPFAMNDGNSTTYYAIRTYMQRINVQPNVVFSVSDYDISEPICRLGYVAAACPQIFVPTVLEHNRSRPFDEQLLLLPIQGLEQALRFDLLSNKIAYHPSYVHEFFALLREEVQRCIARAEIGALQSAAT